MKKYKTIFLALSLGILPLVAEAQSAPFPIVGKSYRLIHSSPDESPINQSHRPKDLAIPVGEVLILQKGGNNWVKVEYTIAVVDQKTSVWSAKKIQNWINMAKVSMAVELPNKE